MYNNLISKLDVYYSKARTVDDLRKRHDKVKSYISKYPEFSNMELSLKWTAVAEVLDKYITKFMGGK